MKNVVREIRTSLIATATLIIILCGVYPLTVWLIGQALFPTKTNGSLIVQNGKTMGSVLIAQGFADSRYFHSRPSAAGEGYDALRSGGGNLGPTSRKLIDAVRSRVDKYRKENHLPPDVPVPADAVTASASGLDPHISLKNALLQAPRVANARRLSEEVVLKMIKSYTEGRELGILGEPRVNVLLLNLALDGKP